MTKQKRNTIIIQIIIGIVCALLTVLAGPVQNEAFSAIIQITDTTGSVNGSSPSINADGTRVAFFSIYDLTGGNADGNSEIFIYDTTIGISQVTTSTGGGNSSPSINADGTRVAFVSDWDFLAGNADGNSEIFIFDTSRGFTQVTTSTGGGNSSPSINADGTRVAFVSDRDFLGGNTDGNSEIFIFDTFTGFTQVTSTPLGKYNIEPSINADGTRIAFISDADITGGNADGNWEVFIFDTFTGFTQVTTTPIGGGDTYSPSINADGTQVAFFSVYDLTGENADGNWEIFLHDATTGIIQVTNSTVGTNGSPSINADGTRVAFFSNRDFLGGNTDGNSEIFIFDTSSGFTEVTNSDGGYNSNPSISADGTRVAFVSESDHTGGNTDGNSEIFLFYTSLEGSRNSGSGYGCFIATATYGSYWAPHVMTLRKFRDEHLLTNKLGTKFVDYYYEYSPPMADYIAKHDSLRSIVRFGLAPLVGFSWLAVNYGMMTALTIFSGILTMLIGGTCLIIKKREIN